MQERNKMIFYLEQAVYLFAPHFLLLVSKSSMFHLVTEK